MTIVVFILILMFCLVSGQCQDTAPQQQPWSMDECIQYALEHNITIKQSEINTQERAVEYSTAKNSIWPSLSANGNQSFSFGRGLSEYNTYVRTNTANTSFGLGADLNLFTGLQTKNNITMGKLQLAAATADYEKIKDDIRIAVMQSYVQILYNQEIEAVAKAQVSIDSAQVVRLEALSEVGKANLTEVAAQRSTLAQSQLTLTQAHNQLILSLLDLTQLLELDHPEQFSIKPMDVSTFTLNTLPSAEQIYNEAIGVRPGIRAEEIRVEYAKTNISLAKGAYSPILTMNGGIMTNYYALFGYENAKFGEQLKNNFNPYLGFSLYIPIFDKLVSQNNVKTAKLRYSNQQMELENVKKALYKEIQQAYYGAVAADDKYKSSKAATESAQKAFELSQASYEGGKITLTEYNESKNNYLKSSSELLKAKYEYLFQTKILDFYRSASN